MYIKPDIEESISELKLFATGEKYDTEYTDYEIFNMAVEALEKQTPKQVIDVNGDYEPDYDCPTCGTRTRFEHQNYCLECGQKLGW